MESKILEAGELAQSFEGMRAVANGVVSEMAAAANAKMNAINSLESCLSMVEQLDAYIKEMRNWVAERERLGEYDASASAIIELAKVTLRMAEFNLVTLRAIINFRMEG